MSDDVVRRYNGARPIQAPAQLLADAIHEVEVLREENARLREALEPFAYIAEHVGEEDARWAVPSAHLRAARAAIREGGEDDI